MPHFDEVALYSGGGLSLHRVSCDGDDGAGPSEECVDRELIIMPLRGRFVFRDGEGRRVIGPATALLLRTGDAYTIEHPDGEADVCLSVKGQFLPRQTASRGRTRGVSAVGYARVQRLLGILAQTPAADRLLVEETLCGALGSAEQPPPSTARDRAVADAVAYAVDLRFGERLGLAELAAAAGVGVFHACRVFRRVMKTSIHRYLEAVRLRHALALLLDTSLPLARIAVDTGFAKQGHLGNAFRRGFGVTPGAVRRTVPRAVLRGRGRDA